MEKLLVTSNFSFSHIVLKKLVLQTRKNQGLSEKGLSHCSVKKGFCEFEKKYQCRNLLIIYFTLILYQTTIF